MYRHTHPSPITAEFEAIRKILNPFPTITNQIETIENLIRSTRGKRMQDFHKACISKWRFVWNGRRRDEKNIPELVCVRYEGFLKTKIAYYTAEHEKMLADDLPFTVRNFSFAPRYFEVAKKYLHEKYTRKTLLEYLGSKKRNCTIATGFLAACDEIFFTTFPESFKTIEELFIYRCGSKACNSRKLIEYALKDHPGPQETVTYDQPCSDGLSILAAAATSAATSPAESRFEASAAAGSRVDSTAALSGIEQEAGSLHLGPMDLGPFNDGTESGGLESAQPESPEGELPLLPFTNFAECNFESRPWGS